MNDLVVLDAEHCLNVLAALHSPKAGWKLWKDNAYNLLRTLNAAEKFVSTRSMTCLPSGKKMDIKNVLMNLRKNWWKEFPEDLNPEPSDLTMQSLNHLWTLSQKCQTWTKLKVMNQQSYGMLTLASYQSW